MRGFAIIVCLCAVLAGAVLPAKAGPTLVFDARSGRVLHAEDATAPWFPASLTKLMTAYLTFRAIRDGRLTADSRIVNSELARSQPPSKIGLPLGATISVDQALRILIVKSANDVAVMLAEAVSGTLDGFVAEMNAVAAELGMSGSHFVNPHGLPDPGQVTTARDLGLLTAAIIRDFPQYDDLFSLPGVKLGKRYMRSHNPLLGKFEGADGMKTGYICASGYNIVARATRGKRSVVAVVLGAPNGKERKETTETLLEQGFQDAWLKSAFARKLADLKSETAPGERPFHMGPTVCAGRYRGAADAYVVDEARQRDAEARQAEASAAGNPMIDGGDENDTPEPPEPPMPTLRPQR
ncbi:MAG: D-alanyl-D-alanine carboxypeptidase [Rhodobiaceae bacterium]|nr:D-alanyl-D-alanine carboxypeptidase [Rhodobiaceae bacterium]